MGTARAETRCTPRRQQRATPAPISVHFSSFAIVGGGGTGHLDPDGDRSRQGTCVALFGSPLVHRSGAHAPPREHGKHGSALVWRRLRFIDQPIHSPVALVAHRIQIAFSKDWW